MPVDWKEEYQRRLASADEAVREVKRDDLVVIPIAGPRVLPRALFQRCQELGPRFFADTVVTEYGVARLWGKNHRQRARELIAVAHPDFRAGAAATGAAGPGVTRMPLERHTPFLARRQP